MSFPQWRDTLYVTHQQRLNKKIHASFDFRKESRSVLVRRRRAQKLFE